MVKQTIVVRKGGGHRIGFKFKQLFVLKIVIADMGYVEIQYTKLKSEQIDSSLNRLTASCSLDTFIHCG